MSVEWMGVVILLAGMACVLVRPGSSIWVGILAMLFGGSAAISLPALGGATISPAYVSLGVLFAALLLKSKLLVSLGPVMPGRPGFPLLLLLVWALFGAMVMPRVFIGQIEVIPVSRSSDTGPAIGILGPVSGNITQSVYALGGLACLCMTTVFARLKDGYSRMAKAFLALAGLNLVMAFLDLFGHYSGLGNLLEVFHTGGYSFLTEASVGGFVKRINGTFPEASAFAAFTLPLFAFSYVLYREGIWRRATGWLAMGSLLAILLATSSAGYLALAAYFMLVVLRMATRAVLGDGRRELNHSARMLVGGTFALAAIAVLLPSVVEQAYMLLDSTILQKAGTDSAEERGMWNEVAWGAFVQSWGLGTGVGSTRASSYVIVLLSNLGLPGTLLFLGFLVAVFRVRAPREAPELVRAMVVAAKHAMVTILLVAMTVATVFELPLMFYMFAGLVCSVPLAFRQKARVPAWAPTQGPRYAGDGHAA